MQPGRRSPICSTHQRTRTSVSLSAGSRRPLVSSCGQASTAWRSRWSRTATAPSRHRTTYRSHTPCHGWRFGGSTCIHRAKPSSSPRRRRLRRSRRSSGYMGNAHKKGGLPGRITLDAKWYIGNELVAYGRKPADYDPAAFQGIHARYVLVIIDEAGGVPKSIFDAVDALATNIDARVVAVGNPDDPASHFATICRPGSGWHVETISAFDTPAYTGEKVPEELLPLLVSPEWVEERKLRWGVTARSTNRRCWASSRTSPTTL